MKKVLFLALCLLQWQKLASAQQAAASSVNGPGALAAAAIVAEYSPSLTPNEKGVLSRMFAGDLNFTFPANQKITVKADSIVCRISDVDVTMRSCDLTFGTHKRTVTGRQANELDMMAVAMGVPPDGAAGSIYESLYHLVCTVDPNAVKQKAGGGADCTFSTQQ